MSFLLSPVRRLFAKRPLLANCLTYGTLYTGAEFSQQTLLRKILADPPEDYDLPLVGRYALLGTFAFPPFLFYWYKFLDRRLPGTAIRTIATKVIVDQSVTVPPILFVFYTAMSAMEGKSDIFEECKNKFWPTFKSSCMFWLPAQTVNFLLMPPTMRVVYIGSCSFVWVNILCILKRGQTDGGEGEKDGKQQE